MKNQNIHIPDHNVFEEQSKTFMQSRKATQLAKKFQSSPYEEEYKPLYYLALIGSFLCNAASILTASTWLFSYAYSIVKDTPVPFITSTIFTGFVLILIEVIQRVLGGKIFRFRLQYNKIFYGILIGTLISGMVSISFSFLGGFDLVKTITTPPLYQEPVLENVTTVEKKYQKFIDDADKTAQDYYERRKYKGRIATEDATKYQEYLDKKIAYQDSLISAVTLVKKQNENKTIAAKAEYQKILNEFNEKNNSKGAGLGGIAIISTLLLYLCLWYIEYYDFKTAIQYGTLVTKTKSNSQQQQNTIEDYKKVLELLQQQEEQIKEKNFSSSSTTTSPQNGTSENGTIQNHFKGLQLPIGFYTKGQRQEQLKNLYIQDIQPYIQELTTINIHSDKHTVTHTNFRTGKLEHLDFKTVNNRVGIYLLKINHSIKKKNIETLPNQVEKLNYWLEKRGEFFIV